MRRTCLLKCTAGGEIILGPMRIYFVGTSFVLKCTAYGTRSPWPDDYTFFRYIICTYLCVRSGNSPWHDEYTMCRYNVKSHARLNRSFLRNVSVHSLDQFPRGAPSGQFQFTKKLLQKGFFLGFFLVTWHLVST